MVGMPDYKVLQEDTTFFMPTQFSVIETTKFKKGDDILCIISEGHENLWTRIREDKLRHREKHVCNE